MSLDQQIATASNPVFAARVRQAMWNTALAVVGEDSAAYTPEQFDKRHQLGCMILSNKNHVVMSSFITAVSTIVGDTDTPEDVSDNDITNAITSVWDDIAGVKSTEKPE